MTASLIPARPSTQDGGGALLAWLRRMRDDNPVWRDEYGVTHVFRYADVLRVLNDHETFSSDISRIMPEANPLSRDILSVIDPPLHRKLRRLVGQAFTLRMITELEPRIRTLGAELLAGIEGDEFDLVDTFAYTLPVIVIAELLGVPPEDRVLFRGWSERMLSKEFSDPVAMQFENDDAEFRELVGTPMEQMREYLARHCAQRRARPTDDLLSRLVAAEVDGQRLADRQVVDFACLLLMAGHVSTTMLLGNTVLCMQDDPGLQDRLRADRSAIPAALEEVMRTRTPITMASRVTTRPAEVAGVAIGENTMVLPWLLSANHDERVFDAPERFRPGRPDAQQLAFGHGIHYCLGAPLARLEGRIALELMLDAFADIRVTPGAEVTYHREGLFGPRTLPVTVRRH
ncbi:cytochrome P450 [Couchioplanes azureus]|uniref:cytochrome P450 n=1 Tax=Couchioplanes caeruleus TaxID=56438 RepID=UPI00166FCF2B|nr:cytochrome P450 [Couchioplanes caeruleus]GGQ76338.1 cytochrome P450 [Couchioplanes caeruleus subsp. azureus]